MARRQAKGVALQEQTLRAMNWCWACLRPTRVAYHGERRITHLHGMCRYTLVIRRCQNPACPRYQRSMRPEAEGALALPQGEFGLDVIALVGRLRFGEQRTVEEIHQYLRAQEVRVALRTVTNLVHRYEELLASPASGSPVADPDRLRFRLELRHQKQVVLAIDGVQPTQGQEVLWVLRDVLSGTVLLARSLLGARAVDLVPLLQEVAAALPVPISAVISDGEQAIGKAVRTALPGVPHQLCQFHYLRQAAAPLVEADRHAMKELKKAVRGVRPLERALEGRTDDEAVAVGGYCLAVRSALTDAGHPPLGLPGVQLHDRLSAITASLERVREKRGACPEVSALHTLLARGLAATAALWPVLLVVTAWVHQAAQVLANHAGEPGAQVQAHYAALLAEMAAQREQAGSLAPAVDHFLAASQRYAHGLFHTYDVPGLPRTNNDLEQLFGAVRYQQRRVSGRKRPDASLVVRGAVRVVAAVVTRQERLQASDLRPRNLARWRTLRQELTQRQEARRAQRRFRRDPAAYLAQLEATLLKPTLPG